MSVTITVDLPSKRVTYSGLMAIREMVAVVLTGCTAADVAGIRLFIREPAGFAEMASCLSFSASGSDFVGTLDLSGAALADEFTGDMANKLRSFFLQVWNTVAGDLVIADRVYIENNPLSAAVQAQTLTPA